MSRVLVIGAYGLIGAEVARSLTARGHEVVALGRDLAVARRVLPGYRWVIHDLRSLQRLADWAPLVAEVDVVVNCAGALQQNPRDDLEVVHLHAIAALVLACEKSRVGIVQISAVGADRAESLPFFRTKAEGDAMIRESSAAWWIFRPGLVIAPSSYGGTTLVRALAAVPVVQPVALPGAQVQTVSVADVALAVARAVEGETPPGTEADLVEDEVHRLVDIIAATRRWLGFPAARLTLRLPTWLVRLVARGADLFGKLGWRAPMRTTAVAALARGVCGDPGQTRRALGRPALGLEQTLGAMPARMEDRLFARTHMLAPFLIFALALSWVVKGAAALISVNPIAGALIANGAPPFMGRAVVATLGALAIAIGLGLCVRSWASRTLEISALVLIFYAAAVTVLVPGLWIDPLGAGINAVPLLVATLAARVLLDTR